MNKIIFLFLLQPLLHAGNYVIRNDTKGGESPGGTIKVTLTGTKKETREVTLKMQDKDAWDPGLAVCLDTIVVEGLDGAVKDLKTTYPVAKSQGCLTFEISIKHSDYNEKEKKPGALIVKISNT